MRKKFSHTFVVCAYKECEYLEDCVLSLKNQVQSSKIIMVTSTDNSFIRSICSKYNIKLYVRKGKSDIQDDWNFGYNKAKSDLVTIVHQDDVYDKYYLKYIMDYYSKYPDSSFVCTDYYILKKGKHYCDLNCKIKAFLKFFLRFSLFNKIKFFKVLSLAFGNSINCPSVTYNKLLIGDNNVFTSDLKFSLDWDTFLKLAKDDGRLGYIPKKLISFRIHNGSATVSCIKSNIRYKEDIIMFSKIWPKFVVKFIMLFYIKANNVYVDVLDD